MFGFKSCLPAIAACASLTLATTSFAASVQDFEGVSTGTGGFGTFTYAGGVQSTFASPTIGEVITGTSGLTSKVLHFTGAGFNGGYDSGTGIDLGYSFASAAQKADFLANTRIEFDWSVPTSTAAAGYSQLYQFTLSSDAGGGFKQFGGSSNTASAFATSTGTLNQNPPYSGQVNHVVIDYTGFRAALTGTPSYLQLAIATNNGGGAPADFYFDNFQLTSVPEPTSLGLAGLAAGGLVARRRRR